MFEIIRFGGIFFSFCLVLAKFDELYVFLGGYDSVNTLAKVGDTYDFSAFSSSHL